MLNEGKVIAVVAVNDLAVAKEFYGGTLGLEQSQENPAGVAYTCGGAELFVYQSPTAASGQATAANWLVDDIESVVSDLASKNVVFEHYDMPGAEFKDGVHTMAGMKAAWFKDPDGNILGISNNLA